MRKLTSYRRTCCMCGEVFYSSRIDAQYDKPACSQKAYRQRAQQKELERKYQLDIFSFELFKQVSDRTPGIEGLLISFLHNHDQETFKEVLRIVSAVQMGVNVDELLSP